MYGKGLKRATTNTWHIKHSCQVRCQCPLWRHKRQTFRTGSTRFWMAAQTQFKDGFFSSQKSLLTYIVFRKHLVKWFLHNLRISKVILLLPETGNYGFRRWLTAQREWKAGREVSEAQTAWVSVQSVASGKQNKTCGFAHDDSSI